MTIEDCRRFRRSPYLLLYWHGQQAVILNTNTLTRCAVQSRLVAFLSRLGEWSSKEELCATGFPLKEGDLEALANSGLLQAEGDVSENGELTFEWDPVELAVQRLTAHGCAYLNPVASFRPTVEPRFADHPVTPLPPPSPPPEMTLGTALERRRSLRTYGERPLSLSELSTLLHHAARVVGRTSDSRPGDCIFRPFPTAGARSELEIYVLANGAVSGLTPGAHYFDPFGHRLLQIRERDEQHKRILRSVHVMANGMLNRDPPVVLLITAVFERVMWKYRNLGISLIYKNVGALFQTLYLVATAFDLAACALGSGDEAENSRWLGLDPLRESQVGCFLVGPPGKEDKCAETTINT